MITTINEFKDNIDTTFKNKLDEHVLAFFIKYGKNYWDNKSSVLEYLQNNDEDHSQDKYVDMLMDALKKAIQKFENNANLADDITILDKETLEPIDPEQYEIDKVIDVITDVEEIKKFEGASNINRTDLNYRQVGKNDILWLTVMLKARNNSAALPLGEMGVVKVKVLQTFYGLNKLKQLKANDIVY